MNLAITLLVAVAIAAVIGTVLQQNQPYPDYVLKFGPFWFEIFKALDLFDVYSASWFLSILTFLVISTSVCVYRHAPNMIKEMQDFRENAQLKSLQRLPHSNQWHSLSSQEQCSKYATAFLNYHHFKSKSLKTDQGLLIAAKKGSGSRLGYIFTHVAIIVICIGGLLDGNVPLKFAEMNGTLSVETRRIPASEVPEQSTLPADNLSFRANIDITEGTSADLAFIDFKDGYLVQKLPFIIHVDDFRIEHYESGQPKSFESDLVIYDKGLPEPVKQTISVNHPFSYKGYTIYQNSFGDGGSQLTLKLRPLAGDFSGFHEMKATVKEPYEIPTSFGKLTMEISDFRPFNVNPDPKSVKKFHNVGPSFQFKLRRATGEANEYLNYMQPIERNGANFYLSGVRDSPAEDFQYWFIPADPENLPDRFMNFLAFLHQPETLMKIALATAQSTQNSQRADLNQQKSVADFMVAITRQFLSGGTESVALHIEESVPENQQRQVTELYTTLLKKFLGNVYLQVLTEEGIDVVKPLDAFNQRFFDDALSAIEVLAHYDAPLFFEISGFKHIEATGLQITKAPGKLLVFPGCLLLILGVFFMFYMPQRRLWLYLQPDARGTNILFAGSAIRNRYDFDKEYILIKNHLKIKWV